MRITSIGTTETGSRRDHNEDDFLIEEGGLYAVCDGMGGHQAGEVAAATAVDALSAAWEGYADEIRAVEAGDLPFERLGEIAADLVQAANREVYLRARREKRFGMGCTTSLVLVANGRAALAHVGDSRCYLARQGEVHQMSRDHTLAAEARRRGMEEDLISDSMEHTLMRAVGIGPAVAVDKLVFPLLAGDRLLLCSDGVLVGPQGERRVERALLEGTKEEVVSRLASGALEAGGDDNLTLVCLDVVDASPTARAEDAALAAELLTQTRFFGDLTLAQAASVVSWMDREVVPSGKVLVEQDGVLGDLILVLEGSLGLDDGGRELRRFGAGSLLGWSRLAGPAPSRAKVTARGKTRVARLSHARFREFMARWPTIAVRMLYAVASGMRDPDFDTL